MKELKFRAWYKGDLIREKYMPFYTVEKDGVVRFEWNDDDTKYPFTYEVGIVLADDDWIVEQYIGTSDKNGNEVYVGDIVIGETTRNIFPIVKQDLFINKEPKDDSIKIIGNIHENGYLLKEYRYQRR